MLTFHRPWITLHQFSSWEPLYPPAVPQPRKMPFYIIWGQVFRLGRRSKLAYRIWQISHQRAALSGSSSIQRFIEISIHHAPYLDRNDRLGSILKKTFRTRSGTFWRSFDRDNSMTDTFFEPKIWMTYQDGNTDKGMNVVRNFHYNANSHA